MRAGMSVKPPGANDTTSVIGLVGKFCACAAPAIAAVAASAKDVRRAVRPRAISSAPIFFDKFVRRALPFEHDLFRKPASTFRDHASADRLPAKVQRRLQIDARSM